MRFNMFKSCIALLILVAFCNTKTSAQESMIPDVSYTYLEKLINIAKEYYPTVKNYQNQKNIAEINLKKAQYSWFDAFSFSYLYQPKTTIDISKPTFFNGYQAGFTLSVGALIQKPLLIKQAKQENQIADNNILENDIAITNEVKQKYFNYIQALTILRVQTISVQDAESMFKSIQYKFEKGEENFQNYSQASINLFNLKQGKINYEGALLKAKSDLESLLGEKLENIN
ncbi:MAG: TolC family protein [Sphingobacteriales bacterium]|nr:TolC family protein [Sphingobacteriales bacterium]